ncbi:hypothetical protein PENSPDRAFT_650858 [Peniophora sp. CONT]|nr:hypothetical protein PENSPDRAFT_650858 [Peniophora sp. CONT]
MDPAFPSMIPLRSSGDDVKISMDDFSALLFAYKTSETTLAMPSGMDAVTHALVHVENAQNWLDRVSRTLQRRTDRLSSRKKSYENSELPVSRLPTEILRIIFELDAETHNTWCSSEHEGWRQRLGAVCRQWRYIVFDHSTLWANDLFRLDNDKALETLHLTKNSLLNMDFTYPFLAYFEEPNDDALTRLIPRAWRFSIPIGYKNDLNDLMKHILSTKLLPHLRTLRLDYSPDSEPITKRRMRHRTIANHPNLRFLRLRNLYMRPPIQGMLVTLDMEFEQNQGNDESGAWATKQPYLDAILEVLSMNPTLQTLRLHYAFLQSKRPLPSTERISLPYLTSLALSHPTTLSAELLDLLSLPAIETVSLSWERELVGVNISIDNGVRVYASMLDAWARALPDHTGGSLQMTLGYHAMLDIKRQPGPFALALEDINKKLGGRWTLLSLRLPEDILGESWEVGAGRCIFTREAEDAR